LILPNFRGFHYGEFGTMGTQGQPDARTAQDQPLGNLPPLDQLLTQYNPLIRSVVSWSKWRFDFHVREDIEQSIRIELSKSIENYHGECTLDYFIKRISIHRCIDEIRRQVRKRNVFVDLFQRPSEDTRDPLETPADETFDPVYQILLRERALALKQLLDRLDATCREAIRHFYLDGMSYKDISGKLGIAVNTVGSRLSKCLDKLREIGREAAGLREEI
jgi:RNA polymerase sigma-70 factor (ECF subfamily)